MDVSHSLLTPLAFLERTSLAFPDRTAVVDGECRLTWAEVRERVRKLALGPLPGFKAPSEIEFGELPKTSTGKVKKYELRARDRRQRSS